MNRILLTLIILITMHPIFGQTFGNAIDLDGLDDYAIVPHHESLNPSDGSWSAAFWLKAANEPQEAPVVMKRYPDGGYTMYVFGFGNMDPHNPEPGKRLRVNYIEDAGIIERSGYTPDDYIDGNCHHYVFVADKTQNSIITYFDGQEVEFTLMYDLGSWPTIENENELFIATSSSEAKIKGTLDELSLWNKALSPSQIQNMMYDTLTLDYYIATDSGLVAYYRFDEFEDLGVGNAGTDDIRDLSFYGNHADSEGSPLLIPSGIFIGIEDMLISDKIKIYPNPTSSVVILQSTVFKLQAAVVVIFDLHGRIILEQLIPKGTHTTEIDVSEFMNGIYFCKLTTANSSTTKKLIIQK